MYPYTLYPYTVVPVGMEMGMDMYDEGRRI